MNYLLENTNDFAEVSPLKDEQQTQPHGESEFGTDSKSRANAVANRNTILHSAQKPQDPSSAYTPMKQEGGMNYPSNSKASENFGSNPGSLRKKKTQ